MKRTLSHLKLVALVVVVTFQFGCHGAKVKPDAAVPVAETSTAPAADENPADPSTLPPPSRDRVLESYSYLQLRQAAAAYKVVEDESLGKGVDATSPKIFGCEIGKAELKTAQDTIRELIDSKMSREQSSYLRGTKSYLRTRGTADCEKSCTCGAILDVLSSVDVRVLNRAERSRNEELLIELQSKSAKQGVEATMECAKQQKWICKSDLLKYLKAHAR